MTTFVKSLAQVVASLWIGMLFTIGFVVAPYLFAQASQGNPDVANTGVAARLIGPLLGVADIVGQIAAPVLVVMLLWLRGRKQRTLGGRWFLAEICLIAAAAVAAINYWLLAPRLHAIRLQLAERYGDYHLADKTDALYREFGSLHGVSTVLFIAGFVAALVSLVCMTQFHRVEAHE